MDIETIYRLYFRDVCLFLQGLTRSEALAEELTQETFFRALDGLKDYDGKQDVRAWLFTVARNAYYDHCRRAKHAAPLEDAETKAADSPDSHDGLTAPTPLPVIVLIPPIPILPSSATPIIVFPSLNAGVRNSQELDSKLSNVAILFEVLSKNKSGFPSLIAARLNEEFTSFAESKNTLRSIISVSLSCVSIAFFVVISILHGTINCCISCESWE